MSKTELDKVLNKFANNSLFEKNDCIWMPKFSFRKGFYL